MTNFYHSIAQADFDRAFAGISKRQAVKIYTGVTPLTRDQKNCLAYASGSGGYRLAFWAKPVGHMAFTIQGSEGTGNCGSAVLDWRNSTVEKKVASVLANRHANALELTLARTSVNLTRDILYQIASAEVEADDFLSKDFLVDVIDTCIARAKYAPGCDVTLEELGFGEKDSGIAAAILKVFGLRLSVER